MAENKDLSYRAKQREIKANTKLILESSSNANLLVDLIETADTDQEEILLTFIKSVHKVFVSFLSNQKLVQKKKPSQHSKDDDSKPEDKEAEDPEYVFGSWLYGKYLLTLRKLTSLLHHNSEIVQELSLCTLMKFLVGEYHGFAVDKPPSFPMTLFGKIFDQLVHGDHNMSALIERFSEFIEYDDVRFYLLKGINKTLENLKTNSEKGKFSIENLYGLLSKVKMPLDKDEVNNFLVVVDNPVQSPDGKDIKPDVQVFLLKAHKKLFSKAWLSFLSQSLPSEIHKKVLLSLHTNVIPHMNDPKMLMDFLTDSYNSGGAISLLALNGVFILIHQYNLDYPDFYKKLYALLEPTIFHVKYQARFFKLLDLFLSSTHLPAYLVAAFIKRLSNLALSAPPQGAILVIMFVGNLMKRHPSCQVLIHKKEISKLVLNGDSQEESADKKESDPYDPKECDPAKCNALQSSLWELKTLQQHFYPKIPSLIEFFEKPLGKVEKEITKFFEMGYNDLFDKQCIKVGENNAVMEYQPPKGILGKEFAGLWSLE